MYIFFFRNKCYFVKNTKLSVVCFLCLFFFSLSFFQSGLPARMKWKYLSCLLLAGFFSYYTFLRSWHFGSETFYMNDEDLGVKRPQFWLSHLQPLRNMFENLTIERESKNDCMVASNEFSDLNEKGIKKSVLLLIVVSTAPSRQDRREAIRQTWWTKCRGKVS